MMNAAILTNHIMGTHSGFCVGKGLQRLIATVLGRMMDHHKIGFAHTEIGGAYPAVHHLWQRIVQRRLPDNFGKFIHLPFVLFIGLRIWASVAIVEKKG
jgi:hypothetical protein